MEFILLLLVFVLLILSFIGSFIPVIPGPPIAYLALLVFHFFIHDLSYRDCNIILNQCLELTSPKEIKHKLINLIKKEMSSNNRIINYEI